MATRESPYPQLGANGQPVPQKYDAYQPQQAHGQGQQQQYSGPPAGAPPQAPQQAYQMPPSNNYAQPQGPPPQQQQYGDGYGNGYGAGGEKVQPLEVTKPK